MEWLITKNTILKHEQVNNYEEYKENELFTTQQEMALQQSFLTGQPDWSDVIVNEDAINLREELSRLIDIINNINARNGEALRSMANTNENLDELRRLREVVINNVENLRQDFYEKIMSEGTRIIDTMVRLNDQAQRIPEVPTHNWLLPASLLLVGGICAGGVYYLTRSNINLASRLENIVNSNNQMNERISDLNENSQRLMSNIDNLNARLAQREEERKVSYWFLGLASSVFAYLWKKVGK